MTLKKKYPIQFYIYSNMVYEYVVKILTQYFYNFTMFICTRKIVYLFPSLYAYVTQTCSMCFYKHLVCLQL